MFSQGFGFFFLVFADVSILTQVRWLTRVKKDATADKAVKKKSNQSKIRCRPGNDAKHKHSATKWIWVQTNSCAAISKNTFLIIKVRSGTKHTGCKPRKYTQLKNAALQSQCNGSAPDLQRAFLGNQSI